MSFNTQVIDSNNIEISSDRFSLKCRRVHNVNRGFEIQKDLAENILLNFVNPLLSQEHNI